MKKVYVRSVGCIDNLLDGKSFATYCRENGWEVVDNPKKADMILLNTCAFDQKHEDISIKDIEELKEYPNAELVVTGCLPKINKDRMDHVFGGRYFSPKEREKLKEIIGGKTKVRWKDQNTISDSEIEELFHRRLVHSLTKLRNTVYKYTRVKIFPNFDMADLAGDQESYFIVVGEGCLGNCSYCAIKNAKGTLVSKPIEDAVQELKNGVAKGFKRFVVTADDTGAYGIDLGTTLPALIKKLVAVEGDFKLNLYHLEANWLIKYGKELEDVFTSKKIDAVFSPIQSGSNRILKLMRRPYTAESYIACIRDLRKKIPNLKLWNQFIIGFPGQTEEDFKQDLRILDELNFDLVQAFAYSDRPGTDASKMDNHISEDVINKRLKRINRKILFKVFLRKLLPVFSFSGSRK